MPFSAYAGVFRSRKILILLLLGFSSGLPLALTAGTLQAWLTVEGIDLREIGLFSLVAQPYTYKFLWAPLMDRYSVPWLGRRRGWLALTQVLLLAGIAWMGTLEPRDSPWFLAALALAVAFLSASQDIVFDAYRADVLGSEERGAGAAASVLGYRIAMLASGGLALVLADSALGWTGTYFVMAALMLVGLIAVWLAEEPEMPALALRSVADAAREAFANFFSREAAAWMLLFIVVYKLGDAFAGSLSTSFLLRGLGLSLTEVGIMNKWLATGATIVGLVIGAALMARLRLYGALLVFGGLQALTNLGFMLLALNGKSYILAATVIAAENLCGGMGTTAFVAFMIALCDRRFSATQYALISALAAIGRVYVGPAAGQLVTSLGWANFFMFTFFIALPGMALLIGLRRRVETLDAGRG